MDKKADSAHPSKMFARKGGEQMRVQRIRFDLVCDPIDMWTVWDNLVDLPACLEGDVLCGLSERRARSLAKMLNEMRPPPPAAKKRHSSSRRAEILPSTTS
jgi:hypothetical protein